MGKFVLQCINLFFIMVIVFTIRDYRIYENSGVEGVCFLVFGFFRELVLKEYGSQMQYISTRVVYGDTQIIVFFLM